MLRKRVAQNYNLKIVAELNVIREAMLHKLITKFTKSQKEGAELVLDANADIGAGGVLKELFGIKIFDGSIAAFANIDQSYPASGSYTFSTSEDFQKQITLEFHRSTNSTASNESFLGVVRIRGYKHEKAEMPLVRVHFELSKNQIRIWVTNEKNNGELKVTLLKNTEGSTVH